jgi:hypothetical protein
MGSAGHDTSAAAEPGEREAPAGLSTDASAEPAGAEARAPTPAQLRRFIKSRPYVPLHELRRRFELNGDLDDVTTVQAPDGATVYVGLPERESRVLADLAREGDIGLEVSSDPRVPIVVGVFPIRPVARG